MQIFVLVLDGNLSVKDDLRRSEKYLEDKICKMKQIQNILASLRICSNQLKTFLEKPILKWNPTKTNTSKVLSWIPNRKKTSKQQYNFCKVNIPLKVHCI